MRKMLGFSALAVVALVAASCGSDDDSASGTAGDDAAGEASDASTDTDDEMSADDAPGGEGSGELTPFVFSYQPAGMTTCLRVTDDRGVFEEHGIDVEWVPATAGPSNATAQLLNGQIQGATTGTSNIVTAVGADVDVVVATGLAEDYDVDGQTGMAVVAGPDSEIETLADLEGKTVAVQAVASAFEVLLAEAMEMEGADFDEVNLVAINFADQAQAVLDGRADAIFSIQPFVSQLIAQGGVYIANPQAIAFGTENTTSAVVYMARDFVEENDELVGRFAAAVVEGNEYCNANPDEVRAAISEYLELPPEAAAAFPLDVFSAGVSDAELERWGELLVEHEVGDIDEAPSAEDVAWSGAPEK